MQGCEFNFNSFTRTKYVFSQYHSPYLSGKRINTEPGFSTGAFTKKKEKPIEKKIYKMVSVKQAFTDKVHNT